MKTVVHALMEGKKTYSELLKLGVPEKTLTRVLKDILEFIGLAKKADGYWIWYAYDKPYNSFTYEIALKHSRELLLGFAALLEANPKNLLHYREGKYQAKSDATFGEPRDRGTSYRLSEFLEEHLQTDYPQIHKNLVNFRKLSAKLEKLKECEEIQFLKKLQGKNLGADRMMMLGWEKEPTESWFQKLSSRMGLFKDKREIPYMLGPFETKEEITSLFVSHGHILQRDEKWYVLGPAHLTFKGFNDFRKTQETTTEVYGELSKKLGILKRQIENGQPLDGHCKLCPSIIINASSST